MATIPQRYVKPWTGFSGLRTYSPELQRDMRNLSKFLDDLLANVFKTIPGSPTGSSSTTSVTDVVAGLGLYGGKDNTTGIVTINVGHGDNSMTIDPDDIKVNEAFDFAWTGQHTWSSDADATAVTIDKTFTQATSQMSAIKDTDASTMWAVDNVGLMGVNCNPSGTMVDIQNLSGSFPLRPDSDILSIDSVQTDGGIGQGPDVWYAGAEGRTLSGSNVTAWAPKHVSNVYDTVSGLTVGVERGGNVTTYTHASGAVGIRFQGSGTGAYLSLDHSLGHLIVNASSDFTIAFIAAAMTSSTTSNLLNNIAGDGVTISGFFTGTPMNVWGSNGHTFIYQGTGGSNGYTSGKDGASTPASGQVDLKIMQIGGRTTPDGGTTWNGIYRFNGTDYSNTPVTGSGSEQGKSCSFNEFGHRTALEDWVIYDFILWRRKLTLSEMQTVETYFRGKYQDGFGIASTSYDGIRVRDGTGTLFASLTTTNDSTFTIQGNNIASGTSTAGTTQVFGGSILSTATGGDAGPLVLGAGDVNVNTAGKPGYTLNTGGISANNAHGGGIQGFGGGTDISGAGFVGTYTAPGNVGGDTLVGGGKGASGQTGGALYLQGGAGTTIGKIYFRKPTNTTGYWGTTASTVQMDLSSISANRIFTFPDATGTFAILEGGTSGSPQTWTGYNKYNNNIAINQAIDTTTRIGITAAGTLADSHIFMQNTGTGGFDVRIDSGNNLSFNSRGSSVLASKILCAEKISAAQGVELPTCNANINSFTGGQVWAVTNDSNSKIAFDFIDTVARTSGFVMRLTNQSTGNNLMLIDPSARVSFGYGTTATTLGTILGFSANDLVQTPDGNVNYVAAYCAISHTNTLVTTPNIAGMIGISENAVTGSSSATFTAPVLFGVKGYAIASSDASYSGQVAASFHTGMGRSSSLSSFNADLNLKDVGFGMSKHFTGLYDHLTGYWAQGWGITSNTGYPATNRPGITSSARLVIQDWGASTSSGSPVGQYWGIYGEDITGVSSITTYPAHTGYLHATYPRRTGGTGVHATHFFMEPWPNTATIRGGGVKGDVYLDDGTNFTAGLYQSVTNASYKLLMYAQGAARLNAQTAAQTVLTQSSGPNDGTFQINANVLVTTSTTHNFTVTVDYTDESNTARTVTLNFSQVAGTIATAITNALGAGPYMGLPLIIRCKASTNMVFKTTGTFTTVTYNVDASVVQIA